MPAPSGPASIPPAAPPAYGMPYGYPPQYPPSSTGRSLLSIVWTIAIVLFLVWALLDFAGLVVSPAYVVPGVQGISSGAISNGNFSGGNGNWTFLPLSSGANGSWLSGGGPGGASDGYLNVHLSAGDNTGLWYLPFRVTGSEPFAGRVSLDVEVLSPGTFTGELIVAIEGSASGLSPSNAVAVVWYNSTSAWTRTSSFEIAPALITAGTYYLKIAFEARNASSPVDVGLDNVHLSWVTNAAVIAYLPLPDPILPLPVLLGYTQDKAAFLTYYAVVVLAILGSGAYYAVRERHLIIRAVRAPLEGIGARLRSRSGWIAVAQVWMAVTFAQFAIVVILALLRVPTPSPINQPTLGSAWSLLFDLANASVYEELVFRALLIGVPMVIGSLIFRWSPPTGMGRTSLRSSFRYLLGGNLKSTSPRIAILGGFVLLVASSVLFGAAHAPSWGSWKVIPAMIAGLGFGYLYLRHGLGAAILAHFVNDYAGALGLENVGGAGLDLITALLLFALAAVGAGFFAWYVLHAWRHFQDLLGSYGVHFGARPVPATAGPGWPPPVPPAYMPTTPVPPLMTSVPPPVATGPVGPPVRNALYLPPGYVPTYRPPPYGFPPVRFQCPSCGWVEARYLDGRFTCLRCGRVS